MLDQDTARALLTIADESGSRMAFVGDRHQLSAVGQGGVLDHAVAWAHPTAVVRLEKVHRFVDPDYAALSLRMRTGKSPGGVFDELHRRGQVVIHASEVERAEVLAMVGARGALVVADTGQQVSELDAAIREHSHIAEGATAEIITAAGDRVGLGDRVTTRRNDRDLQVANRQTWTVAGVGEDGSLVLRGHGRDREVPVGYATRFVELAYATTVHGAQGETVESAHVVIGEHTGAAAAYVAMTRGRESNTAHVVAESVEGARQEWIDVFSRDRADLGPAHARRQAIDAIEGYGAQQRQPVPRRRRSSPADGVPLGL